MDRGGGTSPRLEADRVTDWLHVGAAPVGDVRELLLQSGIHRVIDLRDSFPGGMIDLDRVGIERLHLPVPNYGAPTDDQFEAAMRLADSVAAPPALLIHCGSGSGRAPTLAVALLLRRGMPLNEALERVRTARPRTALSPRQIAWLHSLATARRR